MEGAHDIIGRYAGISVLKTTDIFSLAMPRGLWYYVHARMYYIIHMRNQLAFFPLFSYL